MLKAIEIAWLAGLLEGEGSFLLNRRKKDGLRGFYYYPRIQLRMTDVDVMVMAGALLGKQPHLHPLKKTLRLDRPVDRHHQWSIILSGSRAAGWMMTIYKLMGERRRLRIREVLSKCKYARAAHGRTTLHRRAGRIPCGYFVR